MPDAVQLDPAMAEALAWVFGMIGVGFAGFWPLFRRRTPMLVAQIMIGVFFVLHYLLIGAWSGAAMNGLTALQAALAIPLGTRPGFRFVYLASLPVIATATALTWMGTPSALVALATGFVSVGRWQLDLLRFRALLLCSVPCWFAHNWMTNSVPGMIADVICAVTATVMLHREWRLRRRSAAIAV